MVIGLPWYVVHSSELSRMFELASSGPGTPAGNIPPTLSIDNLAWYFWSVLNSQLLAPMFIFALVGGAWLFVAVVRDRPTQPARIEFLAGGFAAWLIITFATPHHDIRYGLPLLAFLSVLGTGWIVQLPRAPRLAAIAALGLAVAANTLGISFGVGGEAKLALATTLPPTEQFPDRIVLYSTTGFLASAPSRDGDVPGLLEALRRQGVQTVTWSGAQSALPDFSLEGLLPLARIAGLSAVVTQSPEYSRSASVATLIHEPAGAHTAPACTRLSDGTDVWIVRYDAGVRELALYCPTRNPRFYDPGVLG
jgi:hypothetical protein